MKAAVIGISYYQRHLIEQLKNKNFYIIGVDGDADPYCKNMVDEFLHIDVKDSDTIIEQLKVKQINGVFSVASDITLPATSKVASALGLPGMKYQTYKSFESKDRYYDLFDNIGVKVPKTYTIEDLDNLPTKKYIIKPSQGAGNRGIAVVEDVHNFDFTNHQDLYYREGEIHLIQEFIEGQKHSFDGIVYKNKFYPLVFSKSYNRPNSSLSNEIHFSSLIDNSYKNTVMDYCNKIAKHISDDVITPLHMEFISNEEGIYLIDFSLRGGGYDIFTSLIFNATGYDVLENYINSMLGNNINLPDSILTRYAVMNLVYSEKEGVIEWDKKKEYNKDVFIKQIVESGNKVNLPKRDGDRIAYTICYGDTLEEAKTLSTKVELDLNYKVNEL